jgi:hypothetical protein
VLPPAELRPYTFGVAAQLARIPGVVAGLVKDNLNQAADDVERRRFLLANEAVNQIRSGRAMAERMAAKTRTEGGGGDPSGVAPPRSEAPVSAERPRGS